MNAVKGKEERMDGMRGNKRYKLTEGRRGAEIERARHGRMKE